MVGLLAWDHPSWFWEVFLQPGSMNSVPSSWASRSFPPLILKEEKQALSQKNRLPFFLLGLFVVFVITWFNPAGGKGVQVDVAQLTPTLGLYIFVCAMIAICAMVLPGISGSTMLLIFGLYVPIIGAIREFLHMNLSYLPVLIIFGCGVLTGIVGIIRIVKNALEMHRAAMVYFILGLMVGSLYTIVTGPTTLKIPQPAMTFETFSPLCFLLGGIFLYALDKLRKFSEKKLHPEG